MQTKNSEVKPTPLLMKLFKFPSGIQNIKCWLKSTIGLLKLLKMSNSPKILPKALGSVPTISTPQNLLVATKGKGKMIKTHKN